MPLEPNAADEELVLCVRIKTIAIEKSSMESSATISTPSCILRIKLCPNIDGGDYRERGELEIDLACNLSLYHAIGLCCPASVELRQILCDLSSAG